MTPGRAGAELCGRHYPPPEITARRELVRRDLLRGSPHLDCGHLRRLRPPDLELLFDLYDRHFLAGYFRRHFKGQILFSLSTRMTSSAGKTVYPRDLKTLSPQEERYELRISALLLSGYERLDREKSVNGINTGDSLQALQLILEHELCHLIELHCFGESSCRGERFRTLAFNLFGHTESVHRLPLAAEIAAAEYALAVGDRVSFTVEGRRIRGIISRITGRATVMVPDEQGCYRDGAGRRYCKYYAPLHRLRKS